MSWKLEWNLHLLGVKSTLGASFVNTFLSNHNIHSFSPTRENTDRPTDRQKTAQADSAHKVSHSMAPSLLSFSFFSPPCLFSSYGSVLLFPSLMVSDAVENSDGFRYSVAPDFISAPHYPRVFLVYISAKS